MTGRGVEQSMDAVLLVPEIVLAILGFGPMLAAITRMIARPPYAGRNSTSCRRSRRRSCSTGPHRPTSR